MRDFLSQVWMAIARRPLTYFLAVLSLGIGVAAFLCVAALTEAMLAGTTRNWAALAAEGPLIIVSVETRDTQTGFPLDPREIAARVREVMRCPVAVGASYSTTAKMGRRVFGSVPTVASSGDGLRYQFVGRERKKTAGRLLSAADDRESAAVCVVSKRVAESVFADTDAVGQAIRLDGWEFRIVGVVEAGGPGHSGFSVVNVPLSAAQARFRDQPAKSVWVAVMSETTRLKSDMARIVASFKGRLPRNADVHASSPWLDSLDARRDLAHIRLLLGLLATSLLVAGLLGMVSMLLANVSARMREIGVHRALGATRWRQAGQVLAEAGITGLAGGLAGILMGLGLLGFLAAAFRTQLVATPAWLAAAVVASVTTALLAGAIPARAAMEISPMESLRAL